MKGDFTRVTFDPARHFSRVLMQQGRVQLDADFNEQAAILLHYLRTLTADLIGPYGGPVGGDYGFKIGFNTNKQLTIGRGRYYVDGVLCENYPENDGDLPYEEQAGFDSDLPSWPQPESENTYFVYLDVWERHITHVQDERIREAALGGPDTCTRAEVVWQVKLQEVTVLGGFTRDCSGEKNWLATLPTLDRGLLKVGLQSEGKDGDACSIPPESRYRGTENQLYRIEVHRGGPAWDGDIDEGGAPNGNANEAATFKLSRDNGSVVYPITQKQGNTVWLQSLGRDQRTRIKEGDWVEVTDDDHELNGAPGILAEVGDVDEVEMTVTLKPTPDVPTMNISNWSSGLDFGEESTNHPLLRRWDQRVVEGVEMSEGAILITESTEPWFEIEDGIKLQFQQPESTEPTEYRTGDYWLVPARVATGTIEWPSDTGGAAIAVRPHGIEHHYAPLAVIGNKELLYYCRCKFSPLECLSDAAGHGEQSGGR